MFGLLGLFELGGSLGATLLTDRVGKRRSVLVGFAAMGALLLLLPLSEGRWGLFLTLFLLFDLGRDPGESRNLAGIEPARAAELDRELSRLVLDQLAYYRERGWERGWYPPKLP